MVKLSLALWDSLLGVIDTGNSDGNLAGENYAKALAFAGTVGWPVTPIILDVFAYLKIYLIILWYLWVRDMISCIYDSYVWCYDHHGYVMCYNFYSIVLEHRDSTQDMMVIL